MLPNTQVPAHTRRASLCSRLHNVSDAKTPVVSAGRSGSWQHNAKHAARTTIHDRWGQWASWTGTGPRS